MPHAGHWCMRDKCLFHLNTYVGEYIVSTVGDVVEGCPDPGYNRKYETMVFKAEASGNDCCPFRMVSGSEEEMRGYMTPEEARLGHLALCEKYSECNRDGFMSIKHCHFINDVADKIESLNKPVSKNEK